MIGYRGVASCLIIVGWLGVTGVSRADLVGIDFGPGSTPAGWNAAPSPGSYPALRDAAGRVTGISLRTEGRGTPFAAAPHAASLPAGADLAGLDGSFYEFGGTFRARFEGLDPGAGYDVYVFGLRTGAALRQQIQLAGADRVSFVQASDDGLLAVNDGVGEGGRDLGAYAKRVTASAAGTIDVTVVGDGPQGRPFVLAGLALAPAAPATESGTIAAAAPSVQPAAAGSAPVAQAAARPPEATSSGVAVPYSGPAAGVDIVGIHLGMNPDQVKAAIRAHNPRLRIQEYPAEVTISDRNLAMRLNVVRYVREIEAGFGHGVQGYQPATDAAEKIVVRFSPPPNEHTIEQIGREIQYVPGQGPGYEAVLQALAAKYGPATYVRDNNGSSLVQMWQYSGPQLSETQFLQWSTRRNRAVTNNLHSVKGTGYALTSDPIPALRDGGDGFMYAAGVGGAPAPYYGENLGAYVTRQGLGAYIFRTLLIQDALEVHRKRGETWQLARDALQREADKARQATDQRALPRL